MAPGLWNTGNGLQRDQRRSISPGPVSTHTQPDAQSWRALRHRTITAIIPDGLSQHQPKDRTCMESVQRMGFAQWFRALLRSHPAGIPNRAIQKDGNRAFEEVAADAVASNIFSTI